MLKKRISLIAAIIVLLIWVYNPQYNYEKVITEILDFELPTKDALGAQLLHSTEDNQIQEQQFYPVTKVIDGDTFWIDNGSEEGVKVRLIGVDAPESRNVFQKKKGYYGLEAKEYLTELLTNQRVRLEYDAGRLDRYQRTLAYVYLEDGTFINAHLVKNGYATVMTIPPNVTYADLFTELQSEARENGRGLWGKEL